jgi:hypothetical protein
MKAMTMPDCLKGVSTPKALRWPKTETSSPEMTESAESNGDRTPN